MPRWPFFHRGAPEGPHALGRAGERLAARWLKKRRYRVLQRNCHVGVGEADLVCLAPDRRTIVTVEVKTRRVRTGGGGDGFAPEVAVGRAKERKLRQVAGVVARRHGWTDRPLRIDVVAIEWPPRGRPRVRHHPDAVQDQHR